MEKCVSSASVAVVRRHINRANGVVSSLRNNECIRPVRQTEYVPLHPHQMIGAVVN